MSNTQLRVISALVLVFVVGFCIYYSREATLAFITFFSVIAIDEVYTHFLKRERLSVGYFASQLIYIVPLVVFYILDSFRELQSVFVNAAFCLNIFLLVYLFALRLETQVLKQLTRLMPPLGSLLIALPMLSLASVLEQTSWRNLFIVLLIVNFSMDTGAWYFGRRFGRRKLWPSISPKKTLEGFLGGILCASLLGSLMWYLLLDQVSLYSLGIFGFLGAMSQIGDLIQSKIKRQFGIKDSSRIIPGHGGVYDRIDSLLFLAPFYAFIVNTFYF